MQDVLEEITAKFRRAQEHIDSLKVEVEQLLANVPSRPLPDNDQAARDAFQQELNQIVVPIRTRIIAGEAAHQIRSTLDHLVAKLLAKAGNEPSLQSAFPIEVWRPTKPRAIRSYEDKVRGIDDAPKALIESLQPYQRATEFERRNSYLAILKNMNNKDKHREPVLSVVVCKPTLRITVGSEPMEYIPDDPNETGPALDADIVDVQRSLTPHVVFPEYGMITNEPVTDGLFRLFAFTQLSVVRRFRQFL
jgi:hypothetical protein